MRISGNLICVAVAFCGGRECGGDIYIYMTLMKTVFMQLTIERELARILINCGLSLFVGVIMCDDDCLFFCSILRIPYQRVHISPCVADKIYIKTSCWIRMQTRASDSISLKSKTKFPPPKSGP